MLGDTAIAEEFCGHDSLLVGYYYADDILRYAELLRILIRR